MNEDRAERIKVAAANLALAEGHLVNARKTYRRPLKAYDEACQLRLPNEQGAS